MQSDPVTGLLRILEAPSHSEERPESCPLFPGRCDLPLSFPPRSTPLAPLLQPLCPPGCFLSPPGLVGLRAFTLTALPRIFYLQYSNVLPLHFLQVAAQAAESLAPPPGALPFFSFALITVQHGMYLLVGLNPPIARVSQPGHLLMFRAR